MQPDYKKPAPLNNNTAHNNGVVDPKKRELMIPRNHLYNRARHGHRSHLAKALLLSSWLCGCDSDPLPLASVGTHMWTTRRRRRRRPSTCGRALLRRIALKAVCAASQAKDRTRRMSDDLTVMEGCGLPPKIVIHSARHKNSPSSSPSYKNKKKK